MNITRFIDLLNKYPILNTTCEKYVYMKNDSYFNNLSTQDILWNEAEHQPVVIKESSSELDDFLSEFEVS